MKEIKIKISKNKGMIISEWGIFLIGISILLSMFFSLLDIIKSYEDNGIKLGLLLILIYFISKMINWIKYPSSYEESDYIEEIRKELT